MSLGMEVGLGPGHIVLGGYQLLLPKIFDPCLWYPNGYMDQDATWYGGRPRPRPHCVRCRPSSTPKWHSSPKFGPCLLWPKRWMDQDATWYESRPRPRPHCVTWGPSSPSQKGDSPKFSAHVYSGLTVAHLSYY